MLDHPASQKRHLDLELSILAAAAFLHFLSSFNLMPGSQVECPSPQVRHCSDFLEAAAAKHKAERESGGKKGGCGEEWKKPNLDGPFCDTTGHSLETTCLEYSRFYISIMN